MPKQTILIEGKLCGVLDVPLQIRGEYIFAPFSIPYICPVCGTTWAQAIVEHNGQTSRFLPKLMPCRKHSDGSFQVPGSLLIALDRDYNNALLTLPDVVKWEFSRHLDFIKV